MAKWISVKDRLPEDKVEVLFYEKWCGVPGVGYYSEKCEDWNADTEFVEAYGNSYVLSTIESEDVTHWMPLPDPPKEES